MNIAAIDSDIFLLINGWVGKSEILDKLVTLVVNEYFVPVTLALVVFYLWFAASKRQSINREALTIAVFSVGFVNLLIKIANLFILRPRPFDELPTNLLFYRPTDPSFPSNAAALSFALATAVFLVDKKLGLFSIGLAIFYSLSRVYAGVHFPSDVLAGALLGIIVTLLVGRWRILVETGTRIIEKVQLKLRLDLEKLNPDF